MSQLQQGTGTPAGRSAQTGFMGSGTDWGTPVVIGAVAAQVAATADVNEYTGPATQTMFAMLLGSLWYSQTAGTGTVTIAVERSTDGGATWAAVPGGGVPGFVADAAGVAGAPDFVIPIFARIATQTAAGRLRLRHRVTVAVSAGAGSAEAQLQTLVF